MVENEAFEKILAALRDEMRNSVLADLECAKLRSSLDAQSSEVLALQTKLSSRDRDAAEVKLKLERYETLWKAAKNVCATTSLTVLPALIATLGVAVKASTDDCDEIPF